MLVVIVQKTIAITTNDSDRSACCQKCTIPFPNLLFVWFKLPGGRAPRSNTCIHFRSKFSSLCSNRVMRGRERERGEHSEVKSHFRRRTLQLQIDSIIFSRISMNFALACFSRDNWLWFRAVDKNNWIGFRRKCAPSKMGFGIRHARLSSSQTRPLQSEVFVQKIFRVDFYVRRGNNANWNPAGVAVTVCKKKDSFWNLTMWFLF